MYCIVACIYDIKINIELDEITYFGIRSDERICIQNSYTPYEGLLEIGGKLHFAYNQ